MIDLHLRIHGCTDYKAVVGVLREALECHINGLKDAKEVATTDRTIPSLETLTVITGSMDQDIHIGEELLEATSVIVH